MRRPTLTGGRLFLRSGGTVADVFSGVAIYKHTNQGRADLSYYRNKYGAGPTAIVDPTRYQIIEMFELAQTETMRFAFVDKDMEPLPGIPMRVDWYDNKLDANDNPKIATNPQGEFHWVFKYNDASYDPRTQRGPYQIATMDGGIKLIGWGSPLATNHEHMGVKILVLRPGEQPVPPPDDVPPAGPPPGGGASTSTVTVTVPSKYVPLIQTVAQALLSGG